MNKFLLPLFFPILIFSQFYRFKQIGGGFPIGDNLSPTLLFDSNNNNRFDLTFAFPVGRDWQIWEYFPFNRFELAYTAIGHWTGKWATGDIDQDGLIDRLETGPDSLEEVMLVLTYESQNPSSYPMSINWVYRVNTGERRTWYSYFPGDLDGDGRREIFYTNSGDGLLCIMENRGNNNNQMVWVEEPPDGGPSQAFGDFDMDGRMEFASAGGSWHNRVVVYENTGNDQYQVIFIDTITLPNGHFDAFSGNDVNQNGKPEFFINFFVGSYLCRFYLYMWEATGDNRYHRICIDSSVGANFFGEFLRSRCADIDGDGIEEILQAAGGRLVIYKFFQEQPRMVFSNFFPRINSCINSADLNGNGYNEIIISGTGENVNDRYTDILEIEAVRLSRPNGGEEFHPEQLAKISWRTFYPPRCDSLSLFYSIDNGRNYFPIITRVPSHPSDTIYLWPVPDVRSDSCKIRIIAYGPGWQYDESDGVFRITSVGVEDELKRKPPRRFEIYPNPAKSYLAIRLPQTADREILKIYDVVGRLIRIEGFKGSGVFELKISLSGIKEGVYFVQVGKETKKLIIKR